MHVSFDSAAPLRGELGAGGMDGGNEPPKKYVKINGVMKLNPEWKSWKEHETGQPATTARNPEKALPVVSNMDDAMELSEVSIASGGYEIPLAESTDATIEMMQERDICSQVGLSSEEMVDGLGAIFAKYEVPLGLMNKLMCLSEFSKLEFMIDDSGSMGCHSDTKDAQGRTQTRWEEAHVRLKEMFEVLAYVPTQNLEIRFLNRSDVISITRNGETPELFKESAYRQIDASFKRGPSGGTPFKQLIQDSLDRGQGQPIARYFFGDGVPAGGSRAIRDIRKMLIERLNPSENPVTLLSCTNEDAEVEWMKELEEVAPYCAEYDDFSDESDEVRRDQGDALPYTKGFHLVAQLVGAMNPHDLDAMDESVPFTKYTLDNLLGIQGSELDFRHYFDEFKAAQLRRRIESASDRIKKNQNWEKDYHEFLTRQMAAEIPSVQVFKNQLSK